MEDQVKERKGKKREKKREESRDKEKKERGKERIDQRGSSPLKGEGRRHRAAALA